MRDDILIITENHHLAAKGIFGLLYEETRHRAGKYLVTIAGESGAGKSEIAAAVADLFDKNGLPAYIIQQDDYFEYPPRTNALMRLEDIGRIGPGEVRLGLLNENIRTILAGQYTLSKPLVIFSEDRITTETIDVTPYNIIIIEGTYTTLLVGINCKIFIDRDFRDTREDRMKRNREAQDEYLEKILEIEHRIIRGHKKLAGMVITKDYQAFRQ